MIADKQGSAVRIPPIMISRGTHISIWRGVRTAWRAVVGLLIVVAAAVLLLGWYRGVGSLEDTRARLFLTMLGLAAGAWIAGFLAAGARRFPRSGLIGLSALLVSQICYLLLVWTEWKPHLLLWRIWWISAILALTIGHLIWLRLSSGDRRGVVEQLTPVVAGLAGAIAAAIAVRRQVLEDIPLPLLIALAVLVSHSALGSLWIWFRYRRRRRRAPVPLWQKVSWFAAAQATVIAVAFYLGRVTAPEPAIVDLAPSPLAHLTPAQLEAQVTADLARLQTVAGGIEQLGRRTSQLHERIMSAQTAENRQYYLPAEEDELRAEFMTYLAYRAALLRLVAGYAGFQSVRDPALRARCFLVGFGAGATVMGASTALVTTYGEHPGIRRKLNEPDAACGLRSGEFDRVESAIANERNAQTFAEMVAYFQAHREDWRRVGVLPPEQFDWIAGQITASLESIRSQPFNRERARIEELVRRIKRDVYTPIYDAQSVISTLIGDTRMVGRPPFISHEQVLEFQPQLQPGDILLERRNWFASNAFLPGFWPHAAIYVGTIHDLERLGLAQRTADGWTSQDPAVRQRLPRFLEPAHDGEPYTVLESISDGVIFSSLPHSMGADYVAVLRPRLTEEQKAIAIARAFAHEGKPYDFEFDFFSADKLVCTELVYRSFDRLLKFDLVRIMGRDTLPAMEICRKFGVERGREDRQLDFVLFLDAVPAEGRARQASEEEFIASASRPRGFNE